MTLEELRQQEEAALLACEESDNDPPLVNRYADARAARQEAEEAEANNANP